MRLFDTVKSGNVFADLGCAHPEETLSLARQFARKRNGLKLFLAAVAALPTSGCATTRYTTVYCVSHDQQLPSEPPKVKDQLTGEADKDLRIVAGSAIRLRAWGEGLQSILEGCREPAH